MISSIKHLPREFVLFNIQMKYCMNIHECKNLIHERFCTDGPWPNAKENLNRTKALLEKEINEENIKILNIVQKNIEQNI